MMAKQKVFLAHASEDKAVVRRLHSQLSSRGFHPWLDEIDLLPGQNWQIEIPKAIQSADVFLACLSSKAVAKHGYVQKEFRLALNTYAEKPPGSVYLIPVRLDDCTVPDIQLPQLGINLRDIHWLDLWKDGGFDRLAQSIEQSGAQVTAGKRDVRLPAVRLVDLSFVEEPGDYPDIPWIKNTGNFVKLDLKLRNVSSEIAFIKRIVICIENVWSLGAIGFTGAAIPPTADYNVELPIRNPPYSVDCSVSQSIDANGVDRFLLTLHPKKSNHLFALRLRIVYDEDDKSVETGLILFATRDSAVTFPTASESQLLEMERQISEQAEERIKKSWKSARKTIIRNNVIRDAVQNIGALTNEIAASFKNGEPVLNL